MNIIGERISQKRESLHMTRFDLAKAIGVSEQAVSNWERGARVPNSDNLVQLCHAFDVNMEYFLGSYEQSLIAREQVDAMEGCPVSHAAQGAAIAEARLFATIDTMSHAILVLMFVFAAIFSVATIVGSAICIYVGTTLYSPNAISEIANPLLCNEDRFLISLFLTLFAAALSTVFFVFAIKFKNRLARGRERRGE